MNQNNRISKRFSNAEIRQISKQFYEWTSDCRGDDLLFVDNCENLLAAGLSSMHYDIPNDGKLSENDEEYLYPCLGVIISQLISKTQNPEIAAESDRTIHYLQSYIDLPAKTKLSVRDYLFECLNSSYAHALFNQILLDNISMCF